MKKVFVFRTADDHKKNLWDDIANNGILRQGWGIPGSRLSKDGNAISFNDWFNSFNLASQKVWDYTYEEKEAERRYNIITRMLEIDEESLVVVPKMPDWNNFVILKIKGKYSFDDTAVENRNLDYGEDFRHQIGVETGDIKCFSYNSCHEAEAICKSLRGYQSAVNRVNSEDFKEYVHILSKKESEQTERDITGIFSSQLTEEFSALKKKAIAKILEYKPDRYEKLIRQVMEVSGIHVERTNWYNRSGGDVDILGTAAIPFVSELSGLDSVVMVQAKLKSGEDPDDEEGVRQLSDMETEYMNDNDSVNIIKVLISTVPRFSKKCQEAALKNNVTLINGDQIADLMVRKIVKE